MSTARSSVKARSEISGPSKNALLVMNGRQGRVTISLRRINAGKGKKQNKGFISWFPPARDLAASAIRNRLIGVSVAEAIAEVHEVDPGMAYTFAIDMTHTPGLEVHARMSRWIEDAQAKGIRFNKVNFSALTNAPARFVSGGRTA